ncbi:MAG TPA: phage holin family protein [Deltaproteobacteria bacterium]|jgi:putative membrane protein|nr:phage holin family protein [Deltaproteobacteria bacterium]
MAYIFIRWLILTVAVLAAAYVLDGVQVQSFWAALFTAAVLGFMNTFFRPILLLLTLPINVLSLGLFTFIINALLIKMASGVVPGFDVIGFWTAVFAALIISIVNWILAAMLRDGTGRFPPEGRHDDGFIDLEKKSGDRWE